MFKTNQLSFFISLPIALSLISCGGDGGDPVPPNADLLDPPLLICPDNMIFNPSQTLCLQCPLPLIADDNHQSCINGDPDQAIVYYARQDQDYKDWSLYIWNNDDCNGYDEDYVAGVTWDNSIEPTGIDNTYGAYWQLPVLPLTTDADAGNCGNFIIHKGSEKDPGDDDQRILLTGERWAFAISDHQVFNQPTLISDLPIKISNSSGHWLDEKTLLWSKTASMVKLAHDDTAGLTSSDDLTVESALTLTPTELTDAQRAKVPHLADWHAYTHSADTTTVKSLVGQQLVIFAVDNQNQITDASYVQAAKVLDDLYTKTDNDADEADLGLSFDDNGEITTAVWAPTARDMTLKIYDNNKQLLDTYPMQLDDQTGIWSHTLSSSADRHFYRYAFNIYHPTTKTIESLEVTDPYTVSTSTNGKYSQIVNLQDADLKPDGWDDRVSPTIETLESAVIYEGHVRDFSISDQTVTEQHRGKYLAFSESGSAGMQHLKALAQAGVTHFHLLPINDISSINEDASQVIDLQHTVANLCAVNDSAPVCGVEDDQKTLEEVMDSYDPTTDQADLLMRAMRGLDSFNWGYDPHHFNVPEGSYASDPDGAKRVLEVRSMIQGLNQAGLRTVLDVVYNHTSSSQLSDNSVLDKLVPGYYHRYNEVSGQIERSSCCENTATEHQMMAKLVIDSLVLWASEYGFDGFRFDLMGHLPKSLLLAARQAVQAIDDDTYFYGEGWNFGEVVDDRLFPQARQNNLVSTEIGSFNDRYRDIVRHAKLFQSSIDLNDQDHVRLGLAGTTQNYQLKDKNDVYKLGKNFSKASFAGDPADVINYVSKHDKRTLWDSSQLRFPSTMTLADRVRAHNIAATIPLMSQGIPFFQLGGDMLRSKSLDVDSYDSGDWFNRIDYTFNDNNWHVGLPPNDKNNEQMETIKKVIAQAEAAATPTEIRLAHDVFTEMLKIRQQSPLLKLTSEADIIQRVGFHNTGKDQTPGLILMSIDDGVGLTDVDSHLDAMVVGINTTSNQQSISVNTASGFELHSIQANSKDPIVRTASFVSAEDSGTFNIPGLTTAIFVKIQGDEQGDGLLPDPNKIPAPFGETAIYLRGSFNEWNTSNQLVYDEYGSYSYTLILNPGEHQFKVADSDYSQVNLGFEQVNIAENSIDITGGDGGNLIVDLNEQANYIFTINAKNSTNPTISLIKVNSLIDCGTLATVDGYPFDVTGDSKKLFVRGNHSEWGAKADYRLEYKGEKRYQTVAEFTGNIQFKLASDDGSWTTQLYAADSTNGEITTNPLSLDIDHNLAYGNAGPNNNHLNLLAGKYSFLMTLNSDNPASGNSVGKLRIQQCRPD